MASAETVEQVVRRQLSKAFGGIRGSIESAVPTIALTVTFVITKDLRTALTVSITAAVVLLLARIVQRQTPQFVLNSFVGIGIGALFAWRSAQSGGDSDDVALAYFLPGLIYNAAYAVGMIVSIVVRWPIVGFLIGSVTGDPTGWRKQPDVVKLCRNLTWLLVLPCVLRVLVQAPIYLSGKYADDASWYVAALGTSKIAMGWPLQVAALLGMIYLLGRNKIPAGETTAQTLGEPATETE